MPRYFFDVYDGREAMRDEFGTEAESLEDAADEAASLLPEFAREAMPGGQSRDFAALVRDESGHVVYRAALLFRGEWHRPTRAPPEVGASHGRPELERSARLRAEARDLEKRLRDNVRALTAVIEQSLAAKGLCGPARGRASDEAP